MPSASVLLQGRYRVMTPLGEGGGGSVFRGLDLEEGREVALKVVAPREGDSEARRAVLRQARREAALLEALRHPRLPRLYAWFEVDETGYLCMELIEGTNLDDHLLRHGPVDEATAVRWGCELCDVLQALHGQEPPVIFRDLKPANIMLEPSGEIRLVDFGIAKRMDALGGGTGTAARNRATPGFAAPEQYGRSTDARTDVYGLGATLYCLLSGQSPPPASALVSGAAGLPPLARLRSGLSPGVVRAIEAMLQLDASRRPPTAAACRAMLTAPAEPAPFWKRLFRVGA